MKKFIIMIDYRAGSGKVFDYIPVTAHDIVEAIEIADAFMATDVHLMHILEKSGKTDRTIRHPHNGIHIANDTTIQRMASNKPEKR